MKKVATKPATEIAPFNLTDENRVKDLESNRSQEKDDQYEFHAKPVPKKILEGTVVSLPTSMWFKPKDMFPKPLISAHDPNGFELGLFCNTTVA